MKADTHPQYYPTAQVVCACGSVFTVGSTKSQIKVEICSQCHPFYTGSQKFVDAVGKIERFQAKQQAAAKIGEQKQKRAVEKKQEEFRPRTLREMLEQVR